MRILAVGDSFMPTHYFESAFADFGDAHDVTYVTVDDQPSFVAFSESELRLREFQGTPDEVIGQMAGVEVLVVQGAPVSDAVLDASPELALVCCARGGPVNIDLQAVNERGLPLVHTPGKNAEAVADLTLAFLVMLARGLPKAQRFLIEGNHLVNNWDGARFFGSDLRGHSLGLVGYGAIGRLVAHRSIPFGMTVRIYDPFVDAVLDEQVEQVETLEELLAQSDFVSLHARGSAGSENLIDARALSLMKPSAFLVNTARESFVDEAALDDALASGRLAGAALDVLRPTSEPGPHRLLRHGNVVLTPHIGGATHETLRQGAEMIRDEIVRFASGEPMLHVANRQQLSA
jgi:D-3-phosphoglycerate dehydrogenase